MTDDSLVGKQLGGYELRERIGGGSVNVVDVYRGYQFSLRRDVTVQVPASDFRQQYAASFQRGAEIIAQLEHPNIIPIHDYGQADGVPYIVTRYMQGGTLKERLEGGPLSPQEAAGVLRQIASALEYVHSRGMVHRDPSTHNIVFDTGGSAYIADFILLGILNDSTDGITGTPVYMSPERWDSQMPTPASDQYALAAIAYEMLTSHPVFEAANLIELRNLHLFEPPTPLRAHNPELPEGLMPVLERALAKAPADRYPTVMDFARDFEKAAQDAPRHLFISYSRRDKDYAGTLFDHLGQNGFTAWIDRQIEYGDMWFREIDEAIKTCAAFLVLMSPAAYESEWVQKEILLAKRYKKPIFPLLLNGDEFGILIDLQFADVRGGALPNADFLRRLRRAVYGDL
jgi:serine/threonine protein kinase